MLLDCCQVIASTRKTLVPKNTGYYWYLQIWLALHQLPCMYLLTHTSVPSGKSVPFLQTPQVLISKADNVGPDDKAARTLLRPNAENQLQRGSKGGNVLIGNLRKRKPQRCPQQYPKRRSSAALTAQDMQCS